MSSQKGIAQIFIIIILVLGIILVVFLVQTRTNLIPQASISGAALSLNPNPLETSRGCVSELDINLNTGNRKVDGADVILLYDHLKINIVSVQKGDIFPTFPPSTVDNTTGRVQISGLTIPNQPYTGTGRFATLTLKVLDRAAFGATQLRFDFDPNNPFKTNDSNVVENGTIADVLAIAGAGTINIGDDGCSPSASAPISPAPAPSSQTLRGDINGDLKVNILDLNLLRRYLNIEIAKVQKADLDANGVINEADMKILNSLIAAPSKKPQPTPKK
jgi:hypothetical protein